MNDVLEPGTKVMLNGVKCVINSVIHNIDKSWAYEISYASGAEVKYQTLSKDLFDSFGGTVLNEEDSKLKMGF